MKFYVSMTDSFLSGWGKAEGMIAKYVVECESYDEAEIVADNAKARSDQKYVTICSGKPRYRKGAYLVKYQTKEDLPSWFIPGYLAQRAVDERKRELEA